MKKDNKHRNSSLSKVEQEDLLSIKIVTKHNVEVVIDYKKSSEVFEYINNEEGC